MSSAIIRSDVEDQEGLLDNYRSRPRQLARWLLLSRNALRDKLRQVRVELKRLKVRVNDVTKSRDVWRQRAEASDQRIQAMKEEVDRLSAQLAQAAEPVAQKK